MRSYVELRDIETGEIIAQGEMSPTRARAIIKEYARFGYYVEQVA
jgi:hypothetical protein